VPGPSHASTSIHLCVAFRGHQSRRWVAISIRAYLNVSLSFCDNGASGCTMSGDLVEIEHLLFQHILEPETRSGSPGFNCRLTSVYVWQVEGRLVGGMGRWQAFTASQLQKAFVSYVSIWPGQQNHDNDFISMSPTQLEAGRLGPRRDRDPSGTQHMHQLDESKSNFGPRRQDTFGFAN